MTKNTHFDAKLWEKAFKLVQDKNTSTTNKLLYHYTTSHGLMGILQNQNIWATHSSFLNDLYEIQYGIDITKNTLKKLAKNSNSFKKNFCILAIKYFEEMNSKEEEIYIASFCQKSDLLSQWKGYTNFGEGYAIGLNFSKINKQKNSSNSNFISIKKVIYNKKNQKRIINAKTTFMINEALKLITKNKNNSKNITKAFAKSLAYFLNAQSKRFKSDAFNEEKEYRAIFINSSISTNKRVKNSFRIDDSAIIPYVRLNFNKNNAILPIEEIVLGPKINFKKASKSIEFIYKNFNKKPPNIIKSTISLQ